MPRVIQYIGGTLGLLAGIGALAIPGIGPLIAAGPIVATLAGVGAGGAVGGIVGALVGMGIPEYEAKRFEGGYLAYGTGTPQAIKAYLGRVGVRYSLPGSELASHEDGRWAIVR